MKLLALRSPRALARVAGAACLLALAVACGAPGLGDAGLLPGRHLTPEGTLLLVRVDDARDSGDRVVAGSGASVGVALRRVLQANGYDLWTADGASRGQALREAAELKCPLIVEAELTGWNEAALEWRDEPDRVELKLAFYSVPGGQLVAWAHGEREGASVADKVDTAHRLLEPLVEELLGPIFDGEELSEPPGADG